MVIVTLATCEIISLTTFHILGVKSQARALVSPSGRGVPKPTGFAVYRATVDVEKMKPFPELAWILEKHNLNLWYCKQSFCFDVVQL